MNRLFLIIAIVVLAGIVIAPANQAQAQTSTRVVTALSLQGWQISTAQPFTTTTTTLDFTDTVASQGFGSLQFGPLAAGERVVLYAPVFDRPLSQFTNITFDIFNFTGVNSSFYSAYIYVDLPYNGIGTYANGIYDCRYDYRQAGLPAGTWNNVVAGGGNTPAASSNFAAGSRCAATLSENPATAEVMWINLNAGDNSNGDVGLEGAFDNVRVNGPSGTVIYDFENDLITGLNPEPINYGLVRINAGANVIALSSPAGDVARAQDGADIVLPFDADGNGFDTYAITGCFEAQGEIWAAVFLGANGPSGYVRLADPRVAMINMTEGFCGQ